MKLKVGRSLTNLALCIVFGFAAAALIVTPAAADVLVSDNFGNQVLSYNETTGAFIGVVVPNSPGTNGNLDGPVGMRFGTGNDDLFVASKNNNQIIRYNLTAGTNSIFASNATPGAALNQPSDIRFDGSGDLLVANFAGSSVDRFSAGGSSLGPFTPNDLSGASYVTTGPDGLLYVSSFGSGEVLRYNATTGAYQDTFVPAGTLFSATGLAWGPGTTLGSTDLYVADLFGQSVYRFDATTGAPDGLVFTGASSYPSDLAFRPDGSLWVAETGGGGIYRFNPVTGSALDGGAPFIFGGGLIVPGQMLFTVPEPSSLALAALGMAGVVCFRRRIFGNKLRRA